ncbi:MAG: LPS export ABC transporter periplasmic protein LptC [Xanthobacteraceae bacterium]|nr:LPS export ABC transporter periplasmic protein LptC [Xanthobacteraceae bacterium]
MEARFKVAARHSRLVRVLRKAVPATVIVSLLVIAVGIIFNPFRFLKKLPIDLDKISVSGTKITMDQPHVAGFMPDGRPYEVWADAATQDITDPTKVDMQTIHAQVQMEDKSTLTLNSKNGHFDTKSQLLDLNNDILLQTTTGYQAQLSQARVEISTGIVSSDQPVAVKLTNGTLNSQNLRIIDHGASILFGGGVTMSLTLPPESGKPAGGDAASAPATKGSNAQ